jgi:hypothetical protein
MISGKQVTIFEKSVRAKQHFSEVLASWEIVQKEDF